MILPEKDKDWFENYSKAGKEAIRYNKILIDTRNNIGKKFRGKNTGDNDYNESQEKRREDSIDKALNDDNLDHPKPLKRDFEDSEDITKNSPS